MGEVVMLVLNKREPRTIEIAPGVKFTVRPFGQIEVELAAQRAEAGLSLAGSGTEKLARYGITADLSESLIRLTARTLHTAVAIELACAVVTAWEGVGFPTGRVDDAGEAIYEPAPLEPALIAQVLNLRRPDGEAYAVAFMTAATATLRAELAAKKGSAAAPDGSGPAAGTTAGNAPS
jgi:hypothetical protein